MSFQKIEILRSSRPTAVNLMWAIDRMSIVIEACRLSDASDVAENCLLEAKKIKSEDIEINRQIGDHGLDVCRRGMRILTYCNAGALATAGYGTALGVIRSAHRELADIQVYACETRPYLQGARLTVWELMEDQIPVTLMADNMVGYAMAQGLIDLVVVGTDRVAANGDVAQQNRNLYGSDNGSTPWDSILCSLSRINYRFFDCLRESDSDRGASRYRIDRLSRSAVGTRQCLGSKSGV